MKTTQDIEIRIARVEDAEALLAIYAPYVEQTAITYEYEVPTVEEFSSRIAHTLEKYPYLVAELEGQPVGYAYAGPFKTRAAYDWSVETSIYVKRDVRGRGIGRRLYETLEELLVKQGIVLAAACIAYPEKEDEYLNLDSIHFHEKMDYRMVGQFHGCACKFDRWYGMAWMEKQIGKRQEKQSPVIPFSELCRNEERMTGNINKAKEYAGKKR